MHALRSSCPQPPFASALRHAVLGLALCAGVVHAQPLGESRSLHPNGRVKQLVVRLTVDGVPGFRVQEFYDNGRLFRQMHWARGVLEGEARVLRPDGQLDKLVRYRRGAVLTYTGYRNGRVESQIPQDRRTFIHRGRPLTVRWQTYYERLPKRPLVGYSAHGLVDSLLLSRMPEDVLQVLADLNAFADGKTGGRLSQANDIVSCGNGRADLVDDLDLAGRASGAGQTTGTPTGMTAARREAALQAIARPCASGSAGGVGSGFGRPPGGRDSQIEQARQHLDAAIASCNASGPGRSSDLIASGAIGPGAGFTSVAFAEEMAALEAAEAATTTITALEAGATTEAGVAVITGLPAAAATESGATALGGFVALDVLVVGSAVTVAGAAGWAIGTWLNDTPVGKAITKFVADAQERLSADPPPPPPPDPATNPAPAPTPAPAPSPVSQPDPEADTRSACERLADFKSFCERTAWTARQCSAYMGIASGCRGDITRIQVTPHEGDVFAVACPTPGDRAALAERLRCQQLGLFGQPGAGEALGCKRGGGLGRNGPPSVIDPRVVNPVRERLSDPSRDQP